jgi:hypothetical protein
MGRGGHAAVQAPTHRAAHHERLGGLAAGLLVFGVAVDNGGFDAVTWNRALLGLSVLLVVCAFLAGVARPGPVAALLGALTGWTALSYVWSASPASALVEAQRVALYAAAAAAASMLARRLPTWPVAAAIVVVAVWNLVDRVHGGGTDLGANAEPVGYSNGLGLLCVLGLVLLPALPRAWWLAAAPLAAVLVLQDSIGAYAALAVGAAMYVVRRGRIVVVAAAIALLFAAPYVAGSNVRPHYWRVAAREWVAHPLLGSGGGTYVNWWTRERDVPLQTQEAHSLYLETLAELGPIGLLLVGAVLVWPIVRTRRSDLAAAVAAYAVGAAVDFDWELAGVTVPAILLATLATTAAAPRPAPLRAVVPAGAAVAAAALLAYAGNAKLADAQAAARRGDVRSAVANANAARRWQPYSPQPWLVLGDVTHDVAAYRRATELDPADWLLWQRLAGVAQGRLRRLAETKAAQLNPLGN